MAFVDPNEVTPSLPQAGQQPGQQGPVSAGGAGVSGASKQAASTPGQNVPAQPSAQLSAYLGANQPQAAQFAGNIATQEGQQTQAAANAINPAVNTYTGQLYSVPTDQAVNSQVASSPSSLTADQQQTYKNELGAAAQAPNSANTFETTAPYQSLTSNIQNAVQQANLWNSGNNPANLSTALQPYESPNTTAGGTTLDSLLLSQSPGAYNQIQQAVAPAANLQSQLSAGTTQADTALQNAIAADQAATQSAQGAGNTYATNLQNYLNNSVSQVQSDVSAQNLLENTLTQDANAINSGINAEGSLLTSPQNPNGLTGYQSNLTPVNLSSYLAAEPTNITASSVATPQNYADIAALQSLMGSGTPVLPINSSTANQAGTVAALPAISPGNLSAALGRLPNSVSLLSYLLGNQFSPIGGNNVGTQRQDVASLLAALGQLNIDAGVH